MHAVGCEVMFLAWSRGGELQSQLNVSGMQARVFGCSMARNVLDLRRHIKKFQPDIVHVALARPTIGAAITRMTLQRKIKWVAADHGAHEWQEKGVARGKVMDMIMPRLLSMMDIVLSVSESAANQLISRGVKRGRVRVVPNGVDTDRFCPGRAVDRKSFLATCFPKSGNRNIFLIGSAGNLRKIKGYDLLLEAMPKILAENPLARCVVWGEGPDRERLVARAGELKVDHAIQFFGFEPGLEKFLPFLDLYVQPSRIESFGLAAAEAMVCGVPTLVADTGGLNNLVQHGLCGQLFTAGSVDSLADQIVKLSCDPIKRTALANAGSRRIKEHFSRKQMEEKVLAIYEELLGDSDPV